VNKFVTIKPFLAFEKVHYYTFQVKGHTETEVEKFFRKFANDQAYTPDLVNLHDWLVDIGSNRGAKPEYFRFEDSAEALPPPQRFLVEMPVKDLRLYCVRLSNEIVILANGGLKTAQKVQDCPDLLPKFRFVNQLANAITKMIQEKEFRFAGKTILDLEKIEFEIK
jgi:hypothetical protein